MVLSVLSSYLFALFHQFLFCGYMADMLLFLAGPWCAFAVLLQHVYRVFWKCSLEASLLRNDLTVLVFVLCVNECGF